MFLLIDKRERDLRSDWSEDEDGGKWVFVEPIVIVAVVVALSWAIVFKLPHVLVWLWRAI